MARYAKMALVAASGLLILLVGLDNLMDYDTNFEVVRHIMSMDTVPQPNPLGWRAITSPVAHHALYGFIIAVELAAAAATLYGLLSLWSARAASGSSFQRAKTAALLGLTMVFGLYFFGFMAIGGEWFEMWRSQGFNMQEPAFRFIGAIGLVMIFLNQRDD